MYICIIQYLLRISIGTNLATVLDYRLAPVVYIYHVYFFYSNMRQYFGHEGQIFFEMHPLPYPRMLPPPSTLPPPQLSPKLSNFLQPDLVICTRILMFPNSEDVVRLWVSSFWTLKEVDQQTLTFFHPHARNLRKSITLAAPSIPRLGWVGYSRCHHLPTLHQLQACGQKDVIFCLDILSLSNI